MSATEVTECIAALRAGQMTLDEVAARFRRRNWAATRRAAPVTYAEMARQQDVETDVPGSYDEVTAAYDRGELTSEEYRVLSDAVADAINARDRASGHGRWCGLRGAGGSSGSDGGPAGAAGGSSGSDGGPARAGSDWPEPAPDRP